MPGLRSNKPISQRFPVTLRSFENNAQKPSVCILLQLAMRTYRNCIFGDLKNKGITSI